MKRDVLSFWAHCFVFWFLALIPSISIAAMVSVDASQLSTNGFKIFGKGNYNSVSSLSIDPGNYFLGYVSESPSGYGGISGFDFTIEANGTFSYSNELDQFLSGRGTSHLQISGIPIQIQSSLSVKDLWVSNVISWEVAENNPAELRLLPGKHSLGYYMQEASGNVSFNGVEFQVNAEGTATINADEIASGSGSSLLHLKGHRIYIESHLAANDTYLFGLLSWRKSEENPRELHLLPGIYGVGYTSVTQDGNFHNALDFTIDNQGRVTYEDALDTSLDGFGTDVLSLVGMPIQLNFLNYRSSIPVFYLNAVAGYDNNMTQTANIFPGRHEIYYWIGKQQVDIDENGACDLDESISDPEIFYKGSQSLICTNRAPELSIESNESLFLGEPFEMNGIVSDPDMHDSEFYILVNYGDGQSQQIQVNGGSFSLNHLYQAIGTYQVRIDVMDSSQSMASNSMEITVNNKTVVKKDKKLKKIKRWLVAKKKEYKENNRKKLQKIKEAKEFFDNLKKAMKEDKKRLKQKKSLKNLIKSLFFR
ncbi:MAG: PKD domain-containing protein [Oligoflexia bacterium]|nr:PKD domain-containing protein [Oligoflexia bacterium]